MGSIRRRVHGPFLAPASVDMMSPRPKQTSPIASEDYASTAALLFALFASQSGS
jgi:hypothetical protein